MGANSTARAPLLQRATARDEGIRELADSHIFGLDAFHSVVLFAHADPRTTHVGHPPTPLRCLRFGGQISRACGTDKLPALRV